MAQLLLLCLILSNAYLGQVQAQTTVQSSSEPLSNSPAPSPYEAKTPKTRKLGNHQPEVTKSSNVPAPSPSKGKAPQKEGKAQPSKESGLHQIPLGQMVEQNAGIHVQNVHVSKHHKSIDKSVAGGGVILGGLATTFLVAVFCYIRATGRHKNGAASSVPGSPATANATV